MSNSHLDDELEQVIEQLRKELEESKGHSVIAEDKARDFEGRSEGLMLLLGKAEIMAYEADNIVKEVRLINELQAQSIGLLNVDLVAVEQERDGLATYVERLRYANKYRQITLSLPEVDAIFNEQPPHSLVEHDNEVIERCAEIGDNTIILDDLLPPNTTVGDLIRALKTGEGDE